MSRALELLVALGKAETNGEKFRLICRFEDESEDNALDRAARHLDDFATRCCDLHKSAIEAAAKVCRDVTNRETEKRIKAQDRGKHGRVQ